MRATRSAMADSSIVGVCIFVSICSLSQVVGQDHTAPGYGRNLPWCFAVNYRSITHPINLNNGIHIVEHVIQQCSYAYIQCLCGTKVPQYCAPGDQQNADPKCYCARVRLIQGSLLSGARHRDASVLLAQGRAMNAGQVDPKASL